MHRLGGLTTFQSSLLIAGILLMVTILACAEENKLESSDGSEQDGQPRDVDKRYLAALAKSGRLPKFLISQKRQQQDSREENSNVETSQDHLITELSDALQNEKRHIGAFLKSHGKPEFFKPRDNREPLLASPPGSSEREETSQENPDSSSPGEFQKRNVASLARLGRLNPIRYASFVPRSGAGSKRVYVYDDHLNDGNSVENEVGDAIDCEEDEEDNGEGDNNSQDNHLGPNWTQKKRYIAALARSGRLPVWHTQRSWWGGKRDKPSPYWMTYRSGSSAYGKKRLDTSDNDISSKVNSKRCKKSQDVFFEDKRNLAMLARKGLLPFRPYVSA